MVTNAARAPRPTSGAAASLNGAGQQQAQGARETDQIHAPDITSSFQVDCTGTGFMLTCSCYLRGKAIHETLSEMSISSTAAWLLLFTVILGGCAWCWREMRALRRMPDRTTTTPEKYVLPVRSVLYAPLANIPITALFGAGIPLAWLARDPDLSRTLLLLLVAASLAVSVTAFILRPRLPI